MGAFLDRVVRDKNISIFGQYFKIAVVAVGITTEYDDLAANFNPPADCGDL